MDEVDVQPVDVRDELGQRIQLCLHPAPVVFGGPVARELLHRRERHALRLIRDRLLLRPLRRADPATKLRESLLRNMNVEWSDRFALDSAARRLKCYVDCVRFDHGPAPIEYWLSIVTPC